MTTAMDAGALFRCALLRAVDHLASMQTDGVVFGFSATRKG
jgi:hypothetical protein